MKLRKENSNTLEHRRAQNRMAQRRFRQRQSQQKTTGGATTAEQPQITHTHALHPQDSSDLKVHLQQDSSILPTNPGSAEVTTSSSSLPNAGTTTSTAFEFSNTPYGFGVDCLHGRNNGLLGIQSFVSMNNLDLSASELDSISSNPPSIPSVDRSQAASNEHILYGGGGLERASSPKTTASLNGGSDNNNSHESLPGNLDVAGIPTPTSPSSSSSTNRGGGKHGNSGWLSPLHIAAQKGHERIVRVLLQHKIDCNEPDSDGLTPLIHAAIGGHEDVVALLLSRGVQIDKVDSQHRSALHWAVIHRNEAVLKILLDHCTRDQRLVDSYDSDGRTPLHTAIDTGFEAGVQVLLQYGANVHYRARKT